MNISIVAGACSEQNDRYIFDLLKKRDKTKNHIIIAPDRTQFNLERRLFDELGEKCFFDINIISLSRLCKNTLGATTKKILSKQSGVALVSKIVSENSDKLVAFSKASSHIGFASVLFETICLYKSCGITPEQVYVSDENNFSNLKQKDIKFVYSVYEKYLQTEFTDSFNRLRLFAETINADTFKDTIFYFVEFDDFTSLMYDIILKLAKFTDGVYITCTYGKNKTNKNIYSNKVYYDLVSLFKTNKLPFNICNASAFNNDYLDTLCDALLAYNTLDTKKVSSVNTKIFAFENISDEVKYTVADLYSSVLTTKNDYSDYVLVVPNLADYESVLIENLRRLNIPYYIDKSTSLSDNYLIRLLFGVLNVITGNFRLGDFLQVVKSPILNFDSMAVCDFACVLKKIGAIGDMCLNEKLTECEDIKGFLSLIKTERELLANSKSVGEYLDKVAKLFDYICARGQSFFEKITEVESRVVGQVTNKFSNIIDECNMVFSDTVMNFDGFVKMFLSYFEATNISLPPITSNTLFVADFNSSYLSPTKNVYILGCNDGKLPSLNLDNGLVTDDEIAHLPNGKKLTPTIAMLNARKTFKLFEMIFKFKERLSLSFVKSGGDGKLYPNALILSICNITGLSPENQSGVLDITGRNFNSIDINNVVFNSLTPHVAGENLIDMLSEKKIYYSNTNYRSVLSSLYAVAGEREKQILDDCMWNFPTDTVTDHNFLKTNTASASELESFYACPYGHFVRYGLKLATQRENTLKPNDIGTIIHEVLRYTLPEMVKMIKCGNVDTDKLKDFASSKLSAILKTEKYIEISSNKNNNFVIKALYLELNRIVVAVFKQVENSCFVPTEYEYKFEKIKVKGVNLKGFIDRIDTLDDGFVVIDYKTGDNHFDDYTDVLSGKKLQLLIYASAYAKITGKKPMGAFYLPISNAFEDSGYSLSGVMIKDDSNIVHIDKNLGFSDYTSPTVNLRTTSKGKIYSNNYYKNLCISREDFDFLLDFTLGQVERAITKIKSGYIEPIPLVVDKNCVCRYCDFVALCNNSDNQREIKQAKTIEDLKTLGEYYGCIQTK